MPDKKKYPKQEQLGTISQYAEKWGITRNTVYSLLDDGRLTRLIGLDGEPLVILSEVPKNIKEYRERPEFPAKIEKNNDSTKSDV